LGRPGNRSLLILAIKIMKTVKPLKLIERARRLC